MLELSSIPEATELNNPEAFKDKELGEPQDTSVERANCFWNELFIDDWSIESVDTVEKDRLGGSYGEVCVEGEGDRYEVHHMPADSASNLERIDGPAIKMDKEDHRQTASCGMSLEAREYRDTQKELITNGKFREAMQMDIDDIHEKFGDKYDEAIGQMLTYVDQLEKEGRI